MNIVKSGAKKITKREIQFTEHTLGQKQQFYKSSRKKLKGLLLVSWTSLAKLNILPFWTKLHLFTKTLEEYKQRYLMNQIFIKGLITYQGK